MRRNYSKTYLTLTLLFCSIFSFGQNDTIQLPLDELGLEDIRITAEEVAENRVFTASRTLNNVDELPLSIYVVTGEEILRNGYFTLTDVLKSVPGIFVSQPGSAIEGETFVMNGLHGNTHTEILVNNIPVKTNNILGMPIGAQLPIRQAERIEITFGPSGIVHGTEAGAGVINIITRTSERPVYTHADLGAGTQGYSSVNVLFGGKLGKNKRILKFNAYGSSSELSNINLRKVGILSPANYPLNSFIPKRTDSYGTYVFPQSAVQLGLNLNYRSLTISLARMFRRDHSALGSNPLAYNNQNSQTTYGEKISTYHLAFQKDFKKFGIKTSFYAVDHEVDKESSFEYDQPHLKQLLNYAAAESAGENIEDRDLFISVNDTRFFSGKRYVNGREINTKLEQTISIFPLKNLELILGANFELEIGRPYEEFLSDASRSPLDDAVPNTNLFAQAYLTFKKFNLIIGANRYTQYGLIRSNNLSKLLPRFAGLYKINPRLNLRASFSSSFKLPPRYYNAKSGIIEMEYGSAPSLNFDSELFLGRRLNPQQTNYGDLGLRLNLNKKLKFDLTVFYSENDNLVIYNDEFINTQEGFDIQFGYDNFDQLQSKLFGLRTSVKFKNLIPSRELDIDTHFSFFRGEQDLPSGEVFPHIVSQPDYLIQTNISFRLFKKLYMTCENTIVGPTAARSLQTLDQYYYFGTRKYARPISVFTDISFSLPLNNNFKMFAKLSNIFGELNAGIDATGSPDDLEYNLTRTRYFRGGVSYTIN